MSGKRIIVSGVDVLSRRDTTKDIMKGNSLLSYFSFHLGVDQHSTELVYWINSWWIEDKFLVNLCPDRWFDNLFVEDNFL